MKKLMSLLLAALMLLSFAACSGGGGQTNTATQAPSASTNNATQNTSGKWIDTATESEKKERVEVAAVTETLDSISHRVTGISFDRNSTKYIIGSSNRTNKYSSGSEEWSVTGTIYLYDKYGSYVETVKFQQDCMVLSVDGDAFQFGHWEFIINGNKYHN